MLLAFPPIYIDHTSTQVKYEILQDYNVSSTCLEIPYNKVAGDDSILYWENVKTLASNVFFKNVIDDSNSTWQDFIENDFEVSSDFNYTKGFKLKSKITKISTYKPKIVIE